MGGSFQIVDGKRVRIDEELKHHPDGDRARDSDGNPADAPAAAETTEAAAEQSTPARGARRGRAAE